jgi:hypothetical protein
VPHAEWRLDHSTCSHHWNESCVTVVDWWHFGDAVSVPQCMLRSPHGKCLAAVSPVRPSCLSVCPSMQPSPCLANKTHRASAFLSVCLLSVRPA